MATWHSYTKPNDWRTRKRTVLERDHRTCYICHQPGADTVDHVIPVAQGGSHDLTNLAAIHQHPCHDHKTAQEAAAGRTRPRQRRPPEKHPGLI